MSDEKETLQRVQGGLYHLRRGLTPFVEARMKARYREKWLHYASRAVGGSPNAPLDEYGLLKTMIDQWRDVFDEAFTRTEKNRARNFVSTALEARNATSHLSIPMQDDEALRDMITGSNAIGHSQSKIRATAEQIAVQLVDLVEASIKVTGEPKQTSLENWAGVILKRALEMVG